jgi:cytochrome c556
MNYRIVAWASLGLWLVTIVVAAVYFVRGQTAPSTDGRRAVLLSPAERDLVLGEMRTMLSSVHGVVQGASANDLKQVTAAARASGMQAAVDVNPALMAKLPLEFKELGMTVHQGFDDLATAVETGKANRDEVLRRLGTQLSACIGCHASFRIDVAAARDSGAPR